jgi:hypothetical protein
MRLILEINPGTPATRSFTIEPGPPVRVGRVAPAQLVLNDQTVSRQHFEIVFSGRTYRIRDLNSTHGTYVNGEMITNAELFSGDTIVAGVTRLRVRLAEEETEREGGSARSDWDDNIPTTAVETHDSPVIEPTLQEMVVETLRSQPGKLYAILDAARDPLILTRLLECKEEHQSLYEGRKGDQLAAFAPYLVALPSGCSFLETLVRDGWGKSWGVYLTSEQPFKEVRKHLRHFLMVRSSDDTVYFRFYDPRVLRTYLPTCTKDELRQFFGPINRYVLEPVNSEQIQVVSLEKGGIRVDQQVLQIV